MRIHIIGGPGSGKSYLARRFSDALGLPVCDLDDLFWANEGGGYGVRAEPALRDERFREFIAQEAWVVEGVYHQWVAEGFARADVILVLRAGPMLRDVRILRRFVARRLGLVPSSKKGTFSGLMALLRWNHGYDGDNLVRALEALRIHEQKCRSFGAADEAFSFVLEARAC